MVNFGIGGAALAQAPVSSGTIITIAGNGLAGYSGDGGPATNATLNTPYGLAIGPDGILYVADSSNYRVRAINPTTGLITTVAGNGTAGDTGDDGPATNATIAGVNRIAVDRARHALYLGDTDNNRVRKVNLTNGIISDFAGLGFFGYGFSGDGGPATLAEFASPESVCTDGTGRLSITDLFNDRVRQVNPLTGIITTIAGNGNSSSAGDGGLATGASLSPRRLTADSAGNVFVQDTWTNSIRRVAASTGIITTIAGGGTNSPGSGPATNMNIGDFSDLVVSDAGKLFIADTTRVFLVDLATGQFSLFAGGTNGAFSGDGGPALDARFDYISGLALVPGGGLLISSWGHGRVRYVAPDSIILTNDSQQTAFYLPWVSALAGDLTVINNPNLTNLNMGPLTTVSGAVSLSGNTGVAVIDMSSLTTVGGALAVDTNTAATAIDMSALTTITRDLSMSGNTEVGVIDMSSLTSVGGAVAVDTNTAATTIDMSSLTTVTGDLSMSGNTGVAIIDLSSLTTVSGAVAVDTNTAATAIDMSALTTVTGDVSVSGNTGTAFIDMSSLTVALGDIIIGSNAPGTTVDLSNLTSYGCGTNEVTITLEGGTFTLTNGLTVCTNATLTGSSTVDGSITNNGTIEPGASPGQLNLTGHLVLASPSRLRLEIGGYTQSQFDFVNVAGSVTLGGMLAVSLVNSFASVMTNGASFTVLTAASPVLGAFANVTNGGSLTTTEGYARFTVLYAGESTVRLTDLVIVDTDTDGMPDWWEDQYSLNKNSAADAASDLDGDGAANLNEFLAGTVPNNPNSVFHIAAIERQTNDLRVTWTTVAGRSYRLQTNAVQFNGVTSNFADFGPLIPALVVDESTTNILDAGAATNSSARYYRIRIEL